MAALFQTVLMHLALCGLGVSLLLLLLRSRVSRDTLARLLSIWRSLTAFGRVAACTFLFIGFLVADKTNNVPQNMNQPQMQHGGAFLTGFTGLTGLPLPVTHSHPALSRLRRSLRSGDTFPIANPVQQTFAEKKAENWNIRGAWKDSFWLDFENGWVFPWGTNHLSGVEVVSYGQVWASPFDTNAVASAGALFEIVRGLTTFGYEFTPSNSYRFVWTDAAINRDTNNLVSAALELFRNGDVSVTTNGVEELLPRPLPFPHDGFGQDDEWVTANFTNATEILAVGYPQWVDAQVGEGLTNGLYKLSVTVSDDPPETTFLSVGDLSVVVTNAGEYVFLLEKGPAYDLAVFPPSSNVTISAVDDIATMRGTPMMRSFGDTDGGRWIPASGSFWTDYAAGMGYARLWWLPWLCGSPDVEHIGPADGAMTFSAVLSDCRRTNDVVYSWSASDGLEVSSPNSQTTEISVSEMPSWAEANISVTATFGGNTLVSVLGGATYGTNVTPQVHLSLDVPEGIVCGGGRQMLTATFYSDVETNGCIVLRCVSGLDKIEMWSAASNGVLVASSNGWAVTRSHTFTCHLYGKVQCDLEGVEFEYKFIPNEGGVLAATAKSTVFECYAQSIDNTHISGLNVVNPSFLDPQSNAVFRIQVRPETIPSSKIQWSVVSGAATFPSGSAGTEVNVLGSSGMVDLEVRVLGTTDERMHFKSKVQ